MKFDVKKVAKLANLPLNDKEISTFEKQLSAILDYIKKLEEVETKNVEETSNVTGLENITREDVTQPSLPQTEALINTKKQYNGFFQVKSILEQ